MRDLVSRTPFRPQQLAALLGAFLVVPASAAAGGQSDGSAGPMGAATAAFRTDIERPAWTGDGLLPAGPGPERRPVERRAGLRPFEIAEVDPLAVSPAMKAFLDEQIDPGMQREPKLRRLQDAIFDPEEGLGIRYGAFGTFTAAETFDKAAGNCLSFTLLFVSLARELGYVVHFVEVDEVTGWSRRGEVSFNHWHMYAEVELAGGIIQVDFLPWEERRYHARRRIDEARVKAHYYNNLGAQRLGEELGSGLDTAGSLAYFNKALEFDAAFLPARINLAVAQRHAFLVEEAERNLLAVLEAEPRNSQAASNLANLYTAQGRDDEAEKWIKRRDRFQKQNPFYHFRRGMQALGVGDPESAKLHFRRAIVRQVDEAVFHEQMAEAQYQLGEHRKARQSLKRALDYAEDAQKPNIESKLARLDELVGGKS